MAAAPPRIDRAVRLAIALVVALIAFTLVACGGSDDGDETVSPVPLEQRFVTAEDAPGSKADPVETRETIADFDGFIARQSEISIDPDRAEMTAVFQEAGFEGAGLDARFYGETHEEFESHVFSSFIELESEDGATTALDWLETDQMKPCPKSCAQQVATFDVDDIPDARGVHRLATEEDVERIGAEDEEPSERYWVAFAVGPFVYTMTFLGDPGSVSEEQAQEIAAAYYDRLTGD
jgi:hypothetical protein